MALPESANRGYYPKQHLIKTSKEDAWAVQWISNWLKQRQSMPQVQESLDDGYGTSIDKQVNIQIDRAATPAIVPMDKQGKQEGSNGYFDTDTNTISYTDNVQPSTRIHERSHAMNGPKNNGVLLKPQEWKIERIKKEVPNYYKSNYQDYIDILTGDGDVWRQYLTDPKEIYSRLMEIRYMNNIDPKHIWTLDEVKRLRKSKNVKDKYFFSKFSDDFILKLFNEVAQNNKQQDTSTNYAKNGIKLIPKKFKLITSK